MFAGTLGLLIFMILLKTKSSGMMTIIRHLMSPLPDRFENRVEHAVERFISGIVPLKHLRDYPVVFLLSLLIWFCYGLVFFFCLHAFDFVQTFRLPWSASLILLVITTIGVVVPSSPGYVGTYHYLCQISLAMLGVPAGPALSFAAIVHGINFFPILVVGLMFSYHEGIAISKMSEKVSAVEA
jgi:uncharacterized protein (TIRG00374 family)